MRLAGKDWERDEPGHRRPGLGVSFAGTFVVLSALACGTQAQQGGLVGPVQPQGTVATPAPNIPLPQEPSPLSTMMDVVQKRDRLPDETQVLVKRIIVTRLVPRDRAVGTCTEVIYDKLCGQPIKDPQLDQKLTDILDQFHSRLSVFDLEDVAFKVTNYFHGKDHLLDTAFVPPQTVAGGVVNIYVLTGRLGAVTVNGNHRYKAPVLARPFNPLLGQPVSRYAVTQALLDVWEYPGLAFAQRRASIKFSPGKDTGETNLDLEVFEDPLPINVVLSADNAGSQYSGEYRPRMDVSWNNPTGGADQLALGLTYAFSPISNFYYNADYIRPLFTPEWHIGIGASRNAYDLGADIAQLGISGVSEQVYIRLNHLFFQSFKERLTAELRFSRMNAQTKQQSEQISNDQIAPLQLSVDYTNSDVLLAPEGRANRTRVIGSYTHGFGGVFGAMPAKNAPDSSRIVENGEHAGAAFDILNLAITRKQALFWDTDLWLKFNSQWTPDYLVPLEQFAIGGPNSVRAYPTAEWLFDKGYFASLEWEFPVPFLDKLEARREAKNCKCNYVPTWTARNAQIKLSEALKLLIFVDFAEGWLNNARANEFDHQVVTGIGIGINFEARNLRMTFSLATPVGSPAPSNEHDPQFFFSIAYQPF